MSVCQFPSHNHWADYFETSQDHTRYGPHNSVRDFRPRDPKNEIIAPRHFLSPLYWPDYSEVPCDDKIHTPYSTIPGQLITGTLLVIILEQCNRFFVRAMWTAIERLSRCVSHWLTRQYGSKYRELYTSLEQSRFLCNVHWKPAPNVNAKHLWSMSVLFPTVTEYHYHTFVLNDYQFFIESCRAISQKA